MITDENLKDLIIASPVVGVLLFFLRYFMNELSEERKKREANAEKTVEREKTDTIILDGLSKHVETSNKKHDDTNNKIDYIIKKIDK